MPLPESELLPPLEELEPDDPESLLDPEPLDDPEPELEPELLDPVPDVLVPEVLEPDVLAVDVPANRNPDRIPVTARLEMPIAVVIPTAVRRPADRMSMSGPPSAPRGS